MKNLREIFKNRYDLLDEPEVEKLLEYCEQLQDEIVEFKFQKTNNKELAMLDMLKEVIKGCATSGSSRREGLVLKTSWMASQPSGQMALEDKSKRTMCLFWRQLLREEREGMMS